MHLERPLRVLHIGNIANNAYYNAKFQRREGVEADVLCYDDYWVMSSPEWEEADFEGVPQDLFFPDWSALDLKGYERPRWFAQGPLPLCVDYLAAKQQRDGQAAERLWQELDVARKLVTSGAARRSMRAVSRLLPRRVASSLKSRMRRLVSRGTASARSSAAFLERSAALAIEFRKRFPERADCLTAEDLMPYWKNVSKLIELLPYYDVVQANAVDPLYPMLAKFRPYVAFEHGTLRDAPEATWAYKGPFQDAPLSRLTALSYALADHVFITNADCLASARRLGLQSFEPLPHPLDEDAFRPVEESRDSLRERRGGKLLFFCPIRHDWVDKGTDRYIRAIPELARILERNFIVSFTPWGRQVEKSRRLIAELGCGDLVEWVGPLGRVKLARQLAVADVVFDQVIYPSFSGLTPRALSCGTPVIAAYEPSAMEWMFPEPAPVLAARTVDEIVVATRRAIDPLFQRSYRVEARQWVERHHSSKRTLSQTLAAYERLTRARD